MMAASDYYTLLGIDRSASLEEIHGAYRRLARECHPDRNPGSPEAGERFRRINEAYHILADPAQRRAYDAGVTELPAARSDVEATVTVGLREVFLGTSVRFPVPHALVCLACEGKGVQMHAGTAACGACHGSGFGEERDLMGVRIRAVCSLCHGRGRQAGPPEEGPCLPCKGLGWVLEQSTIEVHIPPGVFEGSRLRVPGQ